jgi:hypothetical protein
VAPVSFSSSAMTALFENSNGHRAALLRTTHIRIRGASLEKGSILKPSRVQVGIRIAQTGQNFDFRGFHPFCIAIFNVVMALQV